jgi:hypothetical protein
MTAVMSTRRQSYGESFSEIEYAAEDTLSLSFLDVLSCGLGAAIYLFLIFSVMPHVGQTGAGERTPSQLTGKGTVSRSVGAKIDGWNDIVKNAPIEILVTFIYAPGVAPVAGESFDGRQLRLDGLPRNSESFVPERLANAWRCRTALDHGMKNPTQTITGVLRNEQQLKTNGIEKCEIEVFVGGVRQVCVPFLISQDSMGERRAFELKFAEKEWIWVE